MERVLVDLRVLIVVVVILGAALAVVGVGLVGVYNAPVQHLIYFQGNISAKVINNSTIVSRENLTVTGVPAGALLGFNWVLSGPGGAVGILAYTGDSPSGNNAQVCDEAPQFYSQGSCAWAANGQTLTVEISAMISDPPITPANYTGYVFVQGWYLYSTPAI